MEFQFTFPPFQKEHPPLFWDGIESQRRALQYLQWATFRKEGILLLTGDSGAGKTFVLQELGRRIATMCQWALIRYPPEDPTAFLEHLSLACKIPIQIARSEPFSKRTHRMERFLFESPTFGKHVVIAIDNADRLSDPSLEFLRLLTNLVGERDRLFTLILCDHGDFWQRLQTQSFRPLAQRVFFSARLMPMSPLELEEYVKYRLGEAGGSNEVRIEPKAFKKIYELSSGIPAKINLVMEQTLAAAQKESQRLISERLLTNALKKSFRDSDSMCRSSKSEAFKWRSISKRF